MLIKSKKSEPLSLFSLRILSTLGVPFYRFLIDALVRKYGDDWYTQLVEEIEGS